MQVLAESSSMTGVGLFFQQDTPGAIHVSSVVPGTAAARSGIIKAGDVVVKVDDHSVEGFTLAKLRKLVLGVSGSSMTLTFLRRTSAHTHFYYDVDLMRGSADFLDVVTKLRNSLIERDRLAALLAKQEKMASDLEKDIQTLLNHPPVKVEDPRVRDLAAEVKNRLEDLARLEQSVARSKDWLSEAQKRKIDTQERYEAQRKANQAEDDKDRDRINYIRDLERRNQDEKALQETVREKLLHDVQLETASRAASESALQQALQQLHRAKEEVIRMRSTEDALRRQVDDMRENLTKVLRTAEITGQELGASLPSIEAGHSWFLGAIQASLYTREGRTAPAGFGPDAPALLPAAPVTLALHRPVPPLASSGPPRPSTPSVGPHLPAGGIPPAGATTAPAGAAATSSWQSTAAGEPRPGPATPRTLAPDASQGLDVEGMARKHGLRIDQRPPADGRLDYRMPPPSSPSPHS